MPVVIFGVGVLAELAILYFKSQEVEVAGFTLDRDYVKEGSFQGLPLVPFDEVDRAFPPETHRMFIAVGYANLNKSREEKFQAATQLGYEMASCISPRAVNNSAALGRNCFIFENAVLQHFSKIGDGAIIWPGAVVCHHATVGDFCYLAPNVTICGGSRLGHRVIAGAGAAVRHSRSVCDDVVFGRRVAADDIRAGSSPPSGNRAYRQGDPPTTFRSSRVVHGLGS